MLKVRARASNARVRWQLKPIGSGAYRAWMTDKGSLTRRLQSQARLIEQPFTVQVLRQAKGQALVDENKLLRLRAQQYANIRDVSLCIGATPVVFAHSVLPLSSLRGAWFGLQALGNKPLGGALFSNPCVVRTPLMFKKLQRHHVLYKTIINVLPSIPASVWARRSIFSLHNTSIMVTEVFLPSVLNQPQPIFK